MGLFNCCKLANLSWDFITTTSKQRPKTSRRKLCCEKLGTSHDLKSSATGSFLECFVVRIANDLHVSLLKTLNTLVKSVQHRSISGEISPKIPMKSAKFGIRLFFGKVISTTAIFFCPQGGHCGKVQLYLKILWKSESFAQSWISYFLFSGRREYQRLIVLNWVGADLQMLKSGSNNIEEWLKWRTSWQQERDHKLKLPGWFVNLHW